MSKLNTDLIHMIKNDNNKLKATAKFPKNAVAVN